MKRPSIVIGILFFMTFLAANNVSAQLNADAYFMLDTNLETAGFQGMDDIFNIGGRDKIGFGIYARQFENVSGFTITFEWDGTKADFRTSDSSTEIIDDEMTINGNDIFFAEESNILGSGLLKAGEVATENSYTSSYAQAGGDPSTSPEGLIFLAVFRTVTEFQTTDDLTIKVSVKIADKDGIERAIGTRFFAINKSVAGMLLPFAQVGEQYDAVLPGVNPDDSFEMVSGPEWMSLDTDTGRLTGLPETTDAVFGSVVVVGITEGDSTSYEKEYGLDVIDGEVPQDFKVFPVFIIQILPDAYDNTEYSTTLEVAYSGNKDDLTFTLLENPEWIAVDSTGVLSGTPGPDDIGVDIPVTITVADAAGLADTLSAAITVIKANLPPEILTTELPDAKVGIAYTDSLIASDPDSGDVVTFLLIENPEWLSADSTGVLSGTPEADDIGVDLPVTITATDTGGLVDTLITKITVITSNEPPEFVSTTLKAASVGFAYTDSLKASDPDSGDVVTFMLIENPEWLSADSTGVLSGTPEADDIGVDIPVTLIVVDPGGLADTLATTITVLAPNQPPVFVTTDLPDAVEGVAYADTLKADNPDTTQAITFELLENPQWMTVDADGVLSGIPGAEDVGVDIPVTVTVTNTDGLADTLNTTLSVLAPNQPPVFVTTDLPDAVEGVVYADTLNVDNPDTSEVIAFELLESPQWLTLEHGSVLSGTPGTDDVGSDIPVTVTAAEPGGFADTLKTTITVLAANLPPTFITTDLPDAAEGIAYNDTLKAVDPDEGDVLTFKSIEKPDWLSIDDAGVLTGTPGAEDVGAAVPVMMAVSDAGGLADTLSTSITIITANHPPAIVTSELPDAVEGVAYTDILKVDDPDEDDVLTYELIENPQWLSIDDEGVLSGIPGAEDAGADLPVTVAVTDAGGLADTLTTSINVIALNRPPVFVTEELPDAAEGIAYFVKLEVNDPDAGDSVSFELIDNPQWLSVDEDGVLSGTPGNDDVGSDIPVTVTVTDTGGLADALVTFITVIEVSNAPTMVSIPAGPFQMGSADGGANEQPVHTVTLSTFYMSTTEITQRQYEVITGANPSDFTGDYNLPVEKVNWFDAVAYCNALSIEQGLQPCYDLTTWECDFTQNGYRLPTEAEWEYAGRAGTETTYYTGNDESDLARAGWYTGNSDSQTHPVGLLEPNDFGLYDMHGNLYEWCHDSYDAEYYSISPSKNPTGPVNDTGRLFRGGAWYSNLDGCRPTKRNFANPNDRSNGVAFRVVRADGITVDRSLELTSPVGSEELMAGDAHDITWESSNIADVSIELSTDNGANWAEITASTDASAGSYSWIVTDIPSVSCLIRISDASVADLSDQSDNVFSISVNNPPVFTTTELLNAAEGVDYVYTLEADDPDTDDVLTYELLENPQWLSVDDNGVLTGIPGADDIGADIPFTVSVTDDGGLADTLATTITVAAVNEPPVFVSEALPDAVEGIAYTDTLKANDPDTDDVLTYELIDNPQWLTIDDNGILSGTPGVDDVGADIQVTVTVSDAGGLTDTLSAVIKVIAVNDPPVFATESLPDATEGVAYTDTLNVDDPDADDVITFELTENPGWLSINDSGILSGTPGAADVGEDITVTVTATDAGGLAAAFTTTINVNNANDPPDITTETLSDATEGVAYSETITVDDPDAGDEISFALIDSPAWLTVDADGILSGSPGPDDVGTDIQITVTATDSGGLDDSFSTTINVINVNNPPEIATAELPDATEGDAYSETVSADDPDANEVLTYELVEGPGWLELDNDGKLSGTPDNDDVGENITVVITVTDDEGLTDTLTTGITVKNTNNHPVIVNTLLWDALAGTAYSDTIEVVDPDVDDTSFTFEITDGPGWLSIDNAGILSGTPAAGDVGLDIPVTITATDNNGLTATLQTKIHVLQDVAVEVTIVQEETVLHIGDTKTYSAQAFNASDEVIETVPIHWSVSGEIGKIDENGLFTALQSGSGQIIASVTARDAFVTSSVGIIVYQEELSLPEINDDNEIFIENATFPLDSVNGAKLSFADNSLPEGIEISIKLPSIAQVDDKTKTISYGNNIIFAITIDIMVDNEVVSPFYFDKPVEITIPFDPAVVAELGIDPKDLRLFYVTPNEELDPNGFTDREVNNNTITVKIYHLSTFAVASIFSGPALLGDFDTNQAIDFYDFVQLMVYWNDGNIKGDIAGEPDGENTADSPPWYTTTYPYPPDGTVDFDDMAAFSLMYNWYQSGGAENLEKPSILAKIAATSIACGLSWDDKGGGVGDRFVVTVSSGSMNSFLGAEALLTYDDTILKVNKVVTGIKLADGKAKTPVYFKTFDGSLTAVTVALGDVSQGLSVPQESLFNIEFEVIGSGDFTIELTHIDIRNMMNVPVEIIGENLSVTGKATGESIPLVFGLSQNYPNPFNMTTRIDYTLDKEGDMALSIFNSLGQQIKTLSNNDQPAGRHSVIWNGTDENGLEVTSGVYIITLKQDSKYKTKQILLLK